MSFKTLYDVIALAPYDGSGKYVRNTDWTDDRDAGIKIMADRHDSQDDDFASALSSVICKDGQSQVTADIPFNGHKLTGVAAPTNPTDAANKAYADAIRSFTTALTISGNDAQGRVNFTGTGTVGLSFAAADLGFGVRTGDEIASHHRFVWNGKPDFSGTDDMVLTDDAQLGIGQVPPFSAGSGVYAGLITTDQSYAMNCYWSNTDSKWHFLTAGWAFLISGDKAAGTAAIYRSTVSGAVDAVITWENLESWLAGKQVVFPSAVFAAGAYLNTDGNISHTGTSIWSAWGYADIFNSVNARIEAQASANAVAVGNEKFSGSRMAGMIDYNHTAGTEAIAENAGYVVTAIAKTGSGNIGERRRQPQLHSNSGGWIVAFPY